jgi:hypothetical protein
MSQFEVVSHVEKNGKKIWRVRIHDNFFYRCSSKKSAEELSAELKSKLGSPVTK